MRTTCGDHGLVTRAPEQIHPAFVERYVVLTRRCAILEKLQIDWIKDNVLRGINIILATFNIANVQTPVDTILNILRSDTVRRLDISTVAEIKKVGKRKKSPKNKWCEYHKKCRHPSEPCEVLKSSKHHSNYVKLLSSTRVKLSFALEQVYCSQMVK